MVSQELLVVQAYLDRLDPEETLVQEVILAQEEAQDPEEILALQGLLAQLVNQASQVLLDLQDNLVCVAILVVRVLQVHEDSQAYQDHRGLPGRQASLVKEVIREAREQQEVPVRRVHRVNEEIPALQVQLVRQGLKDSLELLDLVVDLDQEENPVHKDQLVLQVQLDRQDPQDRQVILDQEVTTVQVGRLEVLDHPDQEEVQEDKEQLGQLAPKGLMVTKERQEVKVQPVKQDHVVI